MAFAVLMHLLRITDYSLSNMTDKKRRSLLKIAGASTLGLIGYSYYQGLRFPPLRWNISPIDALVKLDHYDASLKDVMFLETRNNQTRLRAFAPEPEITLMPNDSEQVSIVINNVHPKATLKHEGITRLHETINGITRHLIFYIEENKTAQLKWEFPNPESYTFATIGDTGGQAELEWCLKRSHELGAEFMLHLGDFNYMKGDYDRAIYNFYNSPIPCYVTIGNHDFKDDGAVYHKFREQISAMNHQFSLGGIRFANIDTAANFLPVDSGYRGELMKTMIAEKDQYRDTVVFTHRPLKDPRPNEDHDIGGVGEIEWFADALKKAGVDKMLCGHVHMQAEVDYEGILNIVSGQGLGHADFMVRKPIAQILMGTVQPGEKVAYKWEDLNMPTLMHCERRHFKQLELNQQFDLMKELEKSCYG